MENNVTDAVLALLMFEQASTGAHESAFGEGVWERDRELQGRRREELEAQEPEAEGEWYGNRMTRLYEQAKRDVIRAKWEAGESSAVLRSPPTVPSCPHVHDFPGATRASYQRNGKARDGSGQAKDRRSA